MVRVNCSPAVDAAEEIEKQRVSRLAEPGRSTPTWTYWPARWPRQLEVGCRVRVATGAVSAPAVSRRIVDDAGANLVGGPHGVDLLEVAVHAVGRGEGGERARPEDALAETGQGGGEAHAALLP